MSLCYSRIAHAVASHGVACVEIDECIAAAHRARDLIDEQLRIEAAGALLVELERLGHDSTPFAEADLDLLFRAVELASADTNRRNEI